MHPVESNKNVTQTIMSKVRFIHTADLHLDTPFRGLTSWNQELAGKLKDSTFHSFHKIIDLCIKENVDFLIISGDIFDSQNKSLAAQLKFVSELRRLSDKGIATYFNCGNHDPLISWIGTIQLPEHVYRFDDTQTGCFTYYKNKEPLADIHGISYSSNAVRKNLAADFKLSDHPSPFSFAVLHGTVGAPGPHANYAPFKIKDVINKGFDYWALGHIHKKQVVRDSQPAIVYPGNPQGRDFGETGIKGCYLVEIDKEKHPSIDFIPTQFIRFEEVYINLSGEQDIGKLPDKINKSIHNIQNYNEKDSYILRVNLSGRTTLHNKIVRHEEREQLIDYFNEGQLNQNHFIWIDQITTSTYPDIDIEQIGKGADFTAEILKVFDKYENDKRQVMQMIRDLEAEFSYQAKKEIKELTMSEQAEVLEKAKWMLLDQLLRHQ